MAGSVSVAVSLSPQYLHDLVGATSSALAMIAEDMELFPEKREELAKTATRLKKVQFYLQKKIEETEHEG